MKDKELHVADLVAKTPFPAGSKVQLNFLSVFKTNLFDHVLGSQREVDTNPRSDIVSDLTFVFQ